MREAVHDVLRRCCHVLASTFVHAMPLARACLPSGLPHVLLHARCPQRALFLSASSCTRGGRARPLQAVPRFAWVGGSGFRALAVEGRRRATI